MTYRPDRKDDYGLWVSRYTENGARFFTRAGMLYHAVRQRTNPTGRKQRDSPLYIGSENHFNNFQDFAKWCQSQSGYFEGYQLDKDLLVKGNKIYSRDTCVFLPQEVNKLMTNRKRFRGDLPLGVTMDGGSIRAACNNGTGKPVYLGMFKDPLQAFNAYRTFKLAQIKVMADKFKSTIDTRAYHSLMNYKILVTD